MPTEDGELRKALLAGAYILAALGLFGAGIVILATAVKFTEWILSW